MNDGIHVPLTEVVGRRTFLKVIGSAGPAIALTACAVPPEHILPYVIPPEDEVPGVATWYATVCRECPAGCGTLVRTREGRAVKVEGNPAHPVNRGGLCIRGQASLQGLYNPDRIPAPQRRRTTNAAAGQSVFDTISWDEARTTFVERILALRQAGRADHIAIVTPSLTGALNRLIESWSHAVGTQRRLRYEPFAYEPIRAANRLSFGRDAIPRYEFATPHVLISFGADFLETWLSNVGYARDFAEMRRVRNGRKAWFIQIEPRLSMTAASAGREARKKGATKAPLKSPRCTFVAHRKAKGGRGAGIRTLRWHFSNAVMGHDFWSQGLTSLANSTGRCNGCR